MATMDILEDLLAALESSGRAGDLRVIAHELTEPTRRGLLTREIDVVLDQNPDAEIRAAITEAMRARHSSPARCRSKSGFSFATICARTPPSDGGALINRRPAGGGISA